MPFEKSTLEAGLRNLIRHLLSQSPEELVQTSLGLHGNLPAPRWVEDVREDGKEMVDVRQYELRLALEQVEDCSERRLVLDRIVLQGKPTQEDWQDLEGKMGQFRNWVLD